jgi:signal transduction histidine kinase
MTPAGLPARSHDQHFDFLAGGGEMGVLTRSLDWSRTPVGPIQSWPQSLRTTVSILLSSRYPMFLFWGPEAVCFYNDGYRPSLGVHKHPKALGQLGRECWGEIWHIIGPQIDAVMQRGEVTWHEDQLVPFDRNGYFEEIYFTYSYSPVREESGGVGGTLVVCTETTDRVIGERRLRTLRDLAVRSAGLRNPAVVVADAGRTLTENNTDVPFALIYKADDNRGTAHLVFVGGVEAGSPGCAKSISLADEMGQTAVWPLDQVFHTGKCEMIAGGRPLPSGLSGGAWTELPTEAVILPLALSGREQPDYVLIAGVSPRKMLDAPYHTFYQLAASQIAASISDAYAYEDERKRAEALSELDRAKTEFFSNVSHEFRTPLTLLLGPLEEILSSPGASLAPEDRARVEIAQRNAIRLLKLVNTLLDFSRIEAGRVNAVYEPLDLATFTAEISAAFRSAIERAGLQFRVDCPLLPEQVYVDSEMWEKIVLNLLSNAFKYTFEGFIEVSLRSAGNGFAELRVSDTGTGVPLDQIPRLFERFHRVEGARGRTQEGTGIGLSLVQELVRLHGGTVSVESTEGKGSTFSVLIPFGSAHLPADKIGPKRTRSPGTFASEAFVYDGSTSASQEYLLQAGLADVSPEAGLLLKDGITAPSPQERARVMVVEDNADLRDYLRRLLSAEYDVIPACDGDQALARAFNDPPDIILSDIMMPRRDGISMMRALRSNPATRAIPVILLSARAGQEASVEGMQAGADDYLAKPFTARELLARVSAHLTLRRERRQAQDQLMQVFRQAPVAICVLRGNDLVFELANPLYQQLLNGRLVVGRPLRDVLPELDNEIFAILRNVLATGEPFVANELLIPMDRDGDGTRENYWFNVVYHPLREPDGTITGVVSVGNDVTQLVQSRSQLETVNRELEEFAHVASHDLREPLRTVKIYTELLLKKHVPSTSSEAVKYADWIGRGVTRMEELIHDLLEYSRSKHETATNQAADVGEAIALAMENLSEAIQSTGAIITTTVNAAVQADPLQVSQLFQNLLANALKYRSPDRRPVVHIASAREGDTWVISVSDNGIGFAQEYADGIFRLFKRLHGQQYPGTGVGLAICKRVVERFGGQIWAKSTLGEGSTFFVQLRAADERGTRE